MSNINKKRNIIYIILIVAVIMVIFSITLLIFAPIERKVINVKFSAGDSFGVGFSGTDELDYGRLIPGTSITRNVTFKNDYPFPIRIKIFATDNIVNLLSLKEEYNIEEGGKISIPVFLDVPRNLTFGNYSGKIELRVFRA